MSGIRTIQGDDSLESVRDELIFTRARLLARPETAALAAQLDPLLARVTDVRDGQESAWQAETEAQARVDVADEDLEDSIDDVDAELKHLDRDPESPRRRRYFKKPPSELRKLGLESTLREIEGWAASLQSEPEVSLQDLGRTLEARVAAGRDALQARTRAASVRGDHRAREILTLLDDVNAGRLGLLGDLQRLASAQRRDASWAARFFRRAERMPRPKKNAEPTGE
ncbi:hypothetical protein [Sandaracinus amylolyticus]|uniref:Uncharacterized protein n=1 Tax=Sandaracinus amylolyticus TaxID=927083 RepID=A0A0F6SDP8_9BACT|nr:hypothetical protein [Sandaracinus amylolyticus]AKF03819.1 hypothetical protein DB32_000968 [Sandaracinus amylolyticus]